MRSKMELFSKPRERHSSLAELMAIVTASAPRKFALFAIAFAYLTGAAAVLGGQRESQATAQSDVIAALQEFLWKPAEGREGISAQPFASTPLSKDMDAAARQVLWQDYASRLQTGRAGEMKERTLREGDFVLPFYYETFGEKPQSGRSLYISLHGGGGAPKAVNDRQWENQKRLYRPSEGVYAAPRAPTDTWNLWHQEHIDGLFDRLIQNFIVFEEVDPNRVYLLGYSAGGDGVYQLAPRMADRLAAASMMAGHPNDASPLGLRNLPFSIHVGEKDVAYNRNKVAAEWGARLDALQQADPGGYVHLTKIYPGKAHWLDREDAAALEWMAQYAREPHPERVVWRLAGPKSARFYWIALEAAEWKAGAEIVATRKGQTIDLTSTGPRKVCLLLCDKMVNLDEAIRVTSGGKQIWSGKVTRTIANLARSLAERGDPRALYSAEVRIELPD